MRRVFTWQQAREQLIQGLLFGCALLSILTTLAIIFVLTSEAVVAMPPRTAFFQEVSIREFFTETRWSPQFAEEIRHYGVLPLVCGTFLITAISGVIGLPCGLLIAVYLSEYASARTRSFCKPMLEILAGVPTVVYGYFALKFLTPYFLMPLFGNLLGWNVNGFNALSGGIVVGIMIIPLVASLSEDFLRSVPNSLRESGYALGATKFDVSTKIVVPSALSGILASFLLALSRSIGETMAVSIAAGQQPVLTLNPFSQIQTMTSFIVNVMQGEVVAGSTLEKSLYAVALLLFLVTLGMNVVSQMILARFREVYQ
ncbi:MAG: phosphate ABC transporter permease subunit PstC [Planctomycetes bacterium]|nr:phosphate ABC transporter permease subunit PstC [Planctomycetota bacterium]